MENTTGLVTALRKVAENARNGSKQVIGMVLADLLEASAARLEALEVEVEAGYLRGQGRGQSAVRVSGSPGRLDGPDRPLKAD